MGGLGDFDACALCSIFSSAKETRARPHEMHIRQSSGTAVPLRSTLGRFSPVSNTSRAASQYIEGVEGSSGRAKLGSWLRIRPMRNIAVPNMA